MNSYVCGCLFRFAFLRVILFSVAYVKNCLLAVFQIYLRQIGYYLQYFSFTCGKLILLAVNRVLLAAFLPSLAPTKKTSPNGEVWNKLLERDTSNRVFIQFLDHFDDQFYCVFVIVAVQDACVRVDVAGSYTD